MSLFPNLQSMQFWPYFFAYFKFNYFVLFLLGGILLALIMPRFWKSSWNPQRALICIFLLGIILRVAWILYSPHQPQMIWGLQVIENDLINLNALDILKGIWFVGADGLPYGRRPIGYPLFLAVIYKVSGPSIGAIWAVHVFLFCGTLFFIYRLSRFIFNREQSLLPAFLFSIYPISIYAVKLVTDENLFLLVWLSSIYFFILALNNH